MQCCVWSSEKRPIALKRSLHCRLQALCSCAAPDSGAQTTSAETRPVKLSRLKKQPLNKPGPQVEFKNL